MFCQHERIDNFIVNELVGTFYSHAYSSYISKLK